MPSRIERRYQIHDAIEAFIEAHPGASLSEPDDVKELARWLRDAEMPPCVQRKV